MNSLTEHLHNIKQEIRQFNARKGRAEDEFGSNGKWRKSYSFTTKVKS